MRAAILTLALLATPAAAGFDGLTTAGRPVVIAADPVSVPPTETADGVVQTGAWHLTSPDAGFGGLSGLLLDGGAVTAVTDGGEWLTATLVPGPPFALTGARMAPLLGGDGRRLRRRGSDFADAEGLARDPLGIAVSLERVHRAILYAPDGTPKAVHRGRRFNALEHNGGMEALATLPDGAVLALVEEPEADGFPLFLLRRGERPVESRLPQVSRHNITGADLGPDGWLYVLFRHFSPATGVSIRLRRYRLGAQGFPDAATREELAAWNTLSGIDNMEAVAVVPGANGTATAWILSDDNFNRAHQRTLLLSLSIRL